MDDRYDPNLLLGYVEDELIAADRARVEAMLAEDSELASLVADLQRDRAALRGARSVDPGVDLAEGAIAAIERQMLVEDAGSNSASPAATPPVRFRLAPLLTYGGIAAVLAITVTVVFQSLQSGDTPTGAIAMNDASPEGMSLAEATLEAQRKAAMANTRPTPDAPPQPEAPPAPTLESTQGQQPQRLARSPQHTAAWPTETRAETERGAGVVGPDLARANKKHSLALLDGEATDSFGHDKTTTTSSLDNEAPLATKPQSVPTPAASMAKGPSENRAADMGLAFEETPAATIEPAPPSAAPAMALADTVRPTDTFEWRGAAPARAIRETKSDDAMGLYRQEPAVAFDAVRAAAPTAASQRYSLNIVTTSPNTSLQHLNDWALRNDIALAVIPDEPRDTAEGDHAVTAAGFADGHPMAGVSRQPNQPLELDAQKPTRVDHDGDAPPFHTGSLRNLQRIQVNVAPDQIDELVTVLSNRLTGEQQQIVSLQPWMNWQAPLQRAEVEVMIEQPRGSTPASPPASNLNLGEPDVKR